AGDKPGDALLDEWLG
nr:RecName: Full=Unknown protein from spot 502 of 2D-PAGE of etiolated coleoptile [Zea mays]